MIDIHGLERRLPGLAAQYRTALPFPHAVMDDFLPAETAAQAAAEVPALDNGWMSYLHVNERKYANTDPSSWGPVLRGVLDALQSETFVRLLANLSGIGGLLTDETLEGGGLHQTRRGGYLNVHTDFSVHPKRRNLRRRLNLLWYLNADWQSHYGGELEFWSADMKRRVRSIAPVFNRAVVFTTDAGSFHGHPEPLACPAGVTRKSLALYYFTEDPAPAVRATNYRARPGEGLRRVPIFLDKTALRAYDAAKRRLPLSDERASRWLRRLDRSLRRSAGKD